MIYTKKKALQITADLWEWLEKHPSKAKRNWPGWKENGGNIEDINGNSCACCDYVTTISRDCSACPLIKLWQEVSSDCYGRGSGYYVRWCDARSPKTRKKYARIIKEGALKVLQEVK